MANTLELVKKLKEQSIDELSNDCIAATGSIFDGMGNQYSDIDLYYISTSENKNRATLLEKIISEHLPSKTIDLSFHDIEEIFALIEKSVRWSFTLNPITSYVRQISKNDLNTLHRFRIAYPISNSSQFNEIQKGISKEKLCALRFAHSVLEIDSSQVDLAGAIDEKEYETALLKCKDLLLSICSAFLAIKNDDNPSFKWIFKKIKSLEQHSKQMDSPINQLNNSALCFFFKLYNYSPSEPWDFVMYASKIVKLANIVVLWGQFYFTNRSFTDISNKLQLTNLFSEHSKQPPLPCYPALSIDCQIRLQNNGTIAFYRNTGKKLAEINHDLLCLLLFFDGYTQIETSINELSKSTGASIDEINQKSEILFSLLISNDFILKID